MRRNHRLVQNDKGFADRYEAIRSFIRRLELFLINIVIYFSLKLWGNAGK